MFSRAISFSYRDYVSDLIHCDLKIYEAIEAKYSSFLEGSP